MNTISSISASPNSLIVIVIVLSGLKYAVKKVCMYTNDSAVIAQIPIKKRLRVREGIFENILSHSQYFKDVLR